MPIPPDDRADEPDATLRGAVLLVDDEPEVRTLLKHIIVRRYPRVQVMEADSGASALDVLELADVDVVLSDHIMPGMDGITLLASVRERRPAAFRILLTGFASTAMAIRAANEGHVDAFLKKPAKADDISSMVGAAIRSTASRRTGRGPRPVVPGGDLLIVDDDPEIRQLLKAYFGQKLPGVHIYSAANAEDGLGILAEHHVDVILADFRLPDMTGVDFLKKARHDYPDTKRVLITGAPEKGLATDASRDHGIDRFFIKPVDMAAFTRAIEKLLPRAP